MGIAHRECLLRHITPGADVLEWGSGGTTLWLADRLPERATLTSIEHHRAWHQRVSGAIGSRPGVQLILAEPDGAVGKNATRSEEDAIGLDGYLSAPKHRKYDVILVDGVARVDCMKRAKYLLKPGGVVFLHDAQRDWYDEGKALFIDHGTIGSCPDYPSPMLWWGGNEPQRPQYSRAACPLIVSCFTRGTPYEEEAARLKASCRKLGLEHAIVPVEPRGSWERNCAIKPEVLLEQYRTQDRPVLWVDADAVMHAPPMMLAGAEPDFAVHKARGWEFASGTIYFNRSEGGERLLRRWAELCAQSPEAWDQLTLDRAWEEVTVSTPLRTLWLPQTYTSIYDMEPDARLGGAEPVIVHHQASRRLKRVVGSGEPRPKHETSDGLISARRACRPRRELYKDDFTISKPDALRIAEHVEARPTNTSPQAIRLPA